MQRVAQQNEANLIQFTAKIIYDDKSSVLLNSWEDFTTYAEAKPLVPEEAVFTWIFLVRFLDKKYPERQQIEVSVDARRLDKRPGFFVIMDDLVFRERYDLERIQIRISHTARTWGADLEALIRGHIDRFVLHRSGIRDFVIRRAGIIGMTAGLFTFMSFPIGSAFFIERMDSYPAIVQVDLISQSILMLQKKLDAFVHYVQARDNFGETLTILIFPMMFVSMAIAILVAKYGRMSEPSFIVLTKEARARREFERRRIRWRWWRFGLSLGSAVCAGLAANFLFAFLK